MPRLCLLAFFVATVASATTTLARHPVPNQHPRLLGSKEELQALAREHPEAYRRVVEVARGGNADEHAKMISLGLVYAIDGDEKAGQQAKQIAMTSTSTARSAKGTRPSATIWPAARSPTTCAIPAGRPTSGRSSTST